MEQNHILGLGQIIIVTYNYRLQPAIVSRVDQRHNEVLVTFINPLVANSRMNYRRQFGPNILIVPNADNYIPYNLEDVLNYTFFNNFDDLQQRYRELLDQINAGNLMLIRPAQQGGVQKQTKSKLSNRIIKRSKQRK
jgi:hypothetical protein